MSLLQRITRWFLAILLVILLSAGLVVSAIFDGGGGTNCGTGSTTLISAASASNLLSKMAPTQLQIASQIISIGKQRGRSEKDIIVALMVAWQESRWKNVRYGDRDSLGIYQQRPSQGWGTPAQIMNPVYAINKFYSALESVKNREAMSLLDIALRVQKPSRAAYESEENKFVSWQPLAQAVLAASQKDAPTTVPPVQQVATTQQVADTSTCAPSGTQAMADLTGGRLKTPVENGVIRSKFGMRFHPILRIWKLHNGVDYAKPSGTPVYASAPGVVSYVGRKGTYGQYIQINHGGGLSTGYAHLSAYAPDIKPEVNVEAGQHIGNVGTTGRSTGPHLHFVLYKNGKPTNPEPYLRK